MPLFDPIYYLFLGPAMLLAIWAQFRVKSAYAKAGKIPARSGLSGAQAAEEILRSHGLDHVRVEPTHGFLGDHYDPRHKVLRLSPDVFRGRSLASLGIAAHEAGHAIQDAERYGPLVIRNGIVPLAGIGSNMAFGVFFVGMMLQWTGMVLAGIVLFSVVVLFQLINLPVEFDASSRARRILLNNGMVTAQEDGTVGKVLNAAALTYVAATLSAILTLLYFLMRSGLLGGRRD